MKNVVPMTRFPLVVTTVTATWITLATAAVAQTPPSNLPAAIFCYAQADQSWRIGYLYRVEKDGVATYIAPDGKLTANVSANGTIEKPKNRPAGVDCYGKTLDELRSTGRLMEFQRPN
jgi:hypothetical protein